jgi:hypothetical protein
MLAYYLTRGVKGQSKSKIALGIVKACTGVGLGVETVIVKFKKHLWLLWVVIPWQEIRAGNHDTDRLSYA